MGVDLIFANVYIGSVLDVDNRLKAAIMQRSQLCVVNYWRCAPPTSLFPRSNTEFVDYAIRVWSKGKVLNERVASITQDIFQIEIIKDEFYFWYETSQNEYEDSYILDGRGMRVHRCLLFGSEAALCGLCEGRTGRG